MATHREKQLQLVGSKGEFDAKGLDKFVESIGLNKAGQKYAVVAIVGSQSGGKSTLLNHLFKTKFKEMDALVGRNQTTQGAWLGVADEGLSPLTLVMDLEGADGRERGVDDTLFERQGALFALVVADIVIYNMWCHDIGRVNGSGMPMLKIVFEEMILMRMESTSRKKTFLFVIRDKTDTPEEKLKIDLLEGMQKMWDALPKLTEREHKPLSAFFDVEVAILPNFIYQSDQWKESVKKLRGLFADSLIQKAQNDGGRLPGESFSDSTKLLWDTIKANKALNLPWHSIVVATKRCNAILDEKFKSFQSDERLSILMRMPVERIDVEAFGKTMGALVDDYMRMYSSETKYYDKEVTASKFDTLRSKILNFLKSVQKSVIKYCWEEAFSSFKQSMDSYFGSNDSGERLRTFSEQLQTKVLVQFDNDAKKAVPSKLSNSDWEEYQSKKKHEFSIRAGKLVQDLRAKKLSEVSDKSKTDLEKAVADCTTNLLMDANDRTWPRISNLCKTETENAISKLKEAVYFMDPTQEEMESTQELLRRHGEKIVRQRAKAVADCALSKMKERFDKELRLDENSNQRQYLDSLGFKHGNLSKAEHEAKIAAVRVLSVLAVVRFEDKTGLGEVYEALKNLVEDAPKYYAPFAGWFGFDDGRSSEALRKEVVDTVLSKEEWEHVSKVDTLLTPSKCKELWVSFQEQIKCSIEDAKRIQNIQQSAATMKGAKYVIAGIPGAVVAGAAFPATTVVLTVAGVAATAVASITDNIGNR